MGTIVSGLGLGGSRSITGIVDNSKGGTIDVQSETLALGGLANQDTHGDLVGGTYTLGGQLQYPGANVTALDAAVSVTGSSSGLVDSTDAGGLRNLAGIGAHGSLSVSAGAATCTSGSPVNAGSLTLDAVDRLRIGGVYTQQTTKPGQVTADPNGTFSTQLQVPAAAG